MQDGTSSARSLSGRGLSRRSFIGTVGGAAVGGAALLAASRARAGGAPSSEGDGLPRGRALRVQPALTYGLPQRRERTSWRPYGGLQTRDDVDREVRRIEDELRGLAGEAEFPLEILPLALVGTDAEAEQVAGSGCDAFLVYAAGGPQHWLERLGATGTPNILFLRHRSGPLYLWYEIAHFRLLRKSEDAIREPHLDVEDIVVDEYDDVLWRLRAFYGLKNTRGTGVVAIGGLASYSRPGQELGPDHARKVWGFRIEEVSHDEVARRLQKARQDPAVVRDVERQVQTLLSDPKVTLSTERRFVVSSFLALRVFKDLLQEKTSTNLGVAHCMGSLIELLDTPPCLVLATLNDEGYTAFCHTDFTHTPPGVLLRWISGKPSFVSNSHYPHHGQLTLAHCAAPRRMNGRDYEPTKILTHFESDHGAATKVEYTKGQVLTNIVPNLHCSRWQGFRGRVLDSPSYEACRSQIDMEIDGDWKALLREMEGFHAITCYGDYLREVGYALKKVGIPWRDYSEPA